MGTSTPDRLYYTGDAAADELLARDPMALLIGYVLDQQVSIQKAFRGPLDLVTRIGTIDATAIAAMDPEALDAAFRQPPALHRFPSNMARRTQEMCAVIARDYGGDAERIWNTAETAAELERRLLELPGIGEVKAKSLIAVLGNRFGLKLPGWDAVAPTFKTLGDVDSPEALAEYQAEKRAKKAAQRASRSSA